jgi:hypothetical protein
MKSMTFSCALHCCADNKFNYDDVKSIEIKRVEVEGGDLHFICDVYMNEGAIYNGIKFISGSKKLEYLTTKSVTVFADK